MIRTVIQRGAQAYHRIASQRAVRNALLQSLLDRREVALRDGTAHNALSKLQALAVAGLELDPHIAELAVAAGLLLVAALRLALLANGFPVSHSGHGQIHIHAELRLQLGNHHIQMLLAQAADDLLAGLGIHAVGQGGILFHQAGQRAADLALVALLGHTDGHGQCGVGNAGAGSLTTRPASHRVSPVWAAGSLVTAPMSPAPMAVVSVCFLPLDVEQLAHALGFAGTGIYQSAVALQGAAGHLHIGQLAPRRDRPRS